ncbi:MAG: flagellar export chaperone FlgN [Ruminiclostridium sp.]|nr:flagellar export chaperone FlgN [Ruminiclostridium sp.]
MTIQLADEIIAYMEKYNDTYRDMVLFLTEKMAKVMDDDLLWLLESVDDEQALIMKIQSQENNRVVFFEELGLDENIKAKELIEKAPAERKMKLQMIYDDLTGYIARIRKLNAGITETVEKKLSVQEELVRGAGMTMAETYNGYGAKVKRTTGTKGFIGSV